MKILRRHIRRWRQRRWWEKRYLERIDDEFRRFRPATPKNPVSIRRYGSGHRRSLGDRFDIFPV
jgi:hypothetical protein